MLHFCFSGRVKGESLMHIAIELQGGYKRCYIVMQMVLGLGGLNKVSLCF